MVSSGSSIPTAAGFCTFVGKHSEPNMHVCGGHAHHLRMLVCLVQFIGAAVPAKGREVDGLAARLYLFVGVARLKLLGVPSISILSRDPNLFRKPSNT